MVWSHGLAATLVATICRCTWLVAVRWVARLARMPLSTCVVAQLTTTPGAWRAGPARTCWIGSSNQKTTQMVRLARLARHYTHNINCRGKSCTELVWSPALHAAFVGVSLHGASTVQLLRCCAKLGTLTGPIDWPAFQIRVTEDYSLDSLDAGPKPFHGTGGTMCVEQPRYENPLHEEFFRACQAVGLPANNDFNNWSTPQVGRWGGRLPRR